MAHTVHLVAPLQDDYSECGRRLLPVGSPVPDWTDEREEATCEQCIEVRDERSYDRQLERESEQAGWRA